MEVDDQDPLETGQGEQATEANDAAELAAFAERMAANGMDDDEGSDHAPAVEDAEEETTSEQAHEGGDEDAGKPDATDVQGIDESLKAALKLDGLPDDLIDLMVKTDRDKAIRYALSRKSAQRDVNLAFQERAELKKKAEAVQTEEPEAKAQPAPDMSELTELLSEELGEDAAGVVVKLFQSTNAELRAELQALKDAQATAQQERITGLVTATRQTLAERFPKVKDDTTWQAIYQSAAVLESHPKLAGISDPETRARKALEWAAREEFGEPEVTSTNAPRRNGKGPTPPRLKSPAKIQSSEAQELEAFRARLAETGNINALM